MSGQRDCGTPIAWIENQLVCADLSGSTELCALSVAFAQPRTTISFSLELVTEPCVFNMHSALVIHRRVSTRFIEAILRQQVAYQGFEECGGVVLLSLSTTGQL